MTLCDRACPAHIMEKEVTHMLAPEAVPAAVGALAAAIAEGMTANELDLLSAIFSQLGDSLAVIAAAQAINEK